MKKKYDIIYSIGRDCGCATYLVQTNKRLTSGPFDWLTKAVFKERLNLLINDFENFLDKEHLQLMPKPENGNIDNKNNYYVNTLFELYFWHDFPADTPFEEVYPHVKEKYDRRIKRLYQNIKEKENVLLIWFSQVDQTSDEIILDLCNKFDEKMGKKVDWLIIEHQEGLMKLKKIQLADNIQRIYCHAQKFDSNGNRQTQGNEALLYPIFKSLKLNLTLKERIKASLWNRRKRRHA